MTMIDPLIPFPVQTGIPMVSANKGPVASNTSVVPSAEITAM